MLPPQILIIGLLITIVFAIMLFVIGSLFKYRSITLLFVVIWFSLTVYSTVELNKLLGYPYNGSLTEEFLLQSYIIDEKNQKIYLWVILKDQTTPRNYSVPYQVYLHEQLDAVGQLMKLGIPVEGALTQGEDGNGETARSPDGEPQLNFTVNEVPQK